MAQPEVDMDERLLKEQNHATQATSILQLGIEAEPAANTRA